MAKDNRPCNRNPVDRHMRQLMRRVTLDGGRARKRERLARRELRAGE